MTDRERLEAEPRRLRAELLWAREDLDHERERLRYALSEVTTLRSDARREEISDG